MKLRHALMLGLGGVAIAALLIEPSLAQTPTAEAVPAAAAPVPNKGDVAWMLISCVLVLLMTVPGLALFYGGLVRTKNMLSVLTQVFAIVSIVLPSRIRPLSIQPSAVSIVVVTTSRRVGQTILAASARTWLMNWAGLAMSAPWRNCWREISRQSAEGKAGREMAPVRSAARSDRSPARRSGGRPSPSVLGAGSA